MEDILIYWGIHALDRTKTNPFPLEYRDWYLQWDLVPESEENQILEILRPKQKSENQLGPEPNIGDEEWSLSFAKPDVQILAFRKYFRDLYTLLPQLLVAVVSIFFIVN
ncbi:MAG: hypothetical protein WDM80_16075 [Limisphaerales bacterium]